MAIPSKSELLQKISELDSNQKQMEKLLADKLAECRQHREYIDNAKKEKNGLWAVYNKFYKQKEVVVNGGD